MKIYKIHKTAMDIHDFYEVIREQEYDIIQEFANGNQVMSWSVIPFGRLKKIWQDYSKFGFVRDESGMQKIKEKMLENLARLMAATNFAGHSQNSPADMYNEAINEDADEENQMTNEKLFDDERYAYFFDTEYGTAYSDYGIKPLSNLALELINAKSAEEQLVLVDRMLNIVHMRGDLAALFVEGGARALQDLFIS